jgi:hypothetical protein
MNGISTADQARIKYSAAAIRNALNSLPYSRQPGTFRRLTQ